MKDYENPELLRDLFYVDSDGRLRHTQNRGRARAGAYADSVIGSNGKRQVSVSINGKRHKPSAHRVVWVLRHGVIPEGYEVCNQESNAEPRLAVSGSSAIRGLTAGRSSAIAASTRHGHIANTGGRKSQSRTYSSWRAMKQRCNCPNKSGYPNYGGRGIAVCEAWAGSFSQFLADMGERPAGKTLDRINVNGNYEPDNCRWATPKEQRLNQRYHELTS